MVEKEQVLFGYQSNAFDQCFWTDGLKLPRRSHTSFQAGHESSLLSQQILFSSFLESSGYQRGALYSIHQRHFMAEKGKGNNVCACLLISHFPAAAAEEQTVLRKETLQAQWLKLLVFPYPGFCPLMVPCFFMRLLKPIAAKYLAFPAVLSEKEKMLTNPCTQLGVSTIELCGINMHRIDD